MTNKATTKTNTHNNTAWIRTLLPTRRMVPMETLEPIKNRLTTISCLAMVYKSANNRSPAGTKLDKQDAKINPTINSGNFIVRFPLREEFSIKTISTGIIHKMRSILDMVATFNASSPYFMLAPTTELVSWMATAAQWPNCSWERPNQWPITGKINSAMTFSRNTVPVAMES